MVLHVYFVLIIIIVLVRIANQVHVLMVSLHVLQVIVTIPMIVHVKKDQHRVVILHYVMCVHRVIIGIQWNVSYV
jgi:hypothetical protein